MADSLPQPGEKIYAIGSPIGLAKTISEGMISGIRNFDQKKLLQITVPISHGSSGCPIINTEGRLVGVAVGGISEANDVNFCIPTTYIKTLIDFKETYPKELLSLIEQHPKQIKSVLIGNQEWMSENLNVSTFRNGDKIPESKTDLEWAKAGEEAKPTWCYVNNGTADTKEYGKLYNWYAVIDNRGLAPIGWHIPTNAEWNTLINYLGGEKIAGDKMKSNSMWSNNGNGTNSSGFTALPTGDMLGAFKWLHTGDHTSFWSSTEDNNNDYPNMVWCREIDYKWKLAYLTSNAKGNGLSCRCIRD